MFLARGRSGRRAEWSEHSTGGVWLDKMWVENIIPPDNPENVRFDSVFCPAGNRTRWHRCQGGEVLVVTSGEGRVARADGQRGVVRTGDAVYFAPGQLHWHGAGGNTFWNYLIRSVGSVEYTDRVAHEDYRLADEMNGGGEFISNGRLPGPSEHKFHPRRWIGGAWLDWILEIDERNLRVVHASHNPGGRTCWHTHGGGQILSVVLGEGRWGSKDNGVVTVRTVRTGDTVYFEPGELHFQAASPDTYVVELCFIVGATSYFDLVSDDEYASTD